VVIVAAMVATGAGAGCDDSEGGASTSAPASAGGRPLASDEPRDEDIAATLDALWAATGVDPANVHIGRYGYSFEPDRESCSDLARDDRWFGYRSSSIGPGLVDQGTIETAITGFLDGEGFEVQRYRSTHPASQLRAFDAVNGDVFVYGYLSADGATDVNVQAGPCAPPSSASSTPRSTSRRRSAPSARVSPSTRASPRLTSPSTLKGHFTGGRAEI
jgi:hypothetical protein